MVSAPDYDGRGAVFVYTANSATGNWTFQAMLQSADATTAGRFGAAVSLSGNSLIVGAPNEADVAGAVYLFQRLGNAWTRKTAVNGAAGQQMGTAVAVFGSNAAAGAPGVNQVHLYDFDGVTWSAGQTLTGAGALAGEFGTALAMDQNTLIVGASTGNAGNGAAGVCVDNGTTWGLQQVLTAGVTGTVGERYGAAVDVRGDRAIIGVPNAGNGSEGAVYSYSRTGNVWGG